MFKVQTLKESIKRVLVTLGFNNTESALEHPEDFSHGDYSTNIALILAKEAKMIPRELAEKIVAELRKSTPTHIEKIEVAGAGFINFFLSPKFYSKTVAEIIKSGEKFGKSDSLKGKKVIIEYTDPNPFKEFHVGHLMSNSIGESISRIYDFRGAKVKRACYQGDVGLHVAKTVWAIQKNKVSLDEVTISVLGSMYSLGSKAYEENAETKKEIEDINGIIYNRSDKEINKLYDTGRRISLDYFEKIYESLGTKFNYYFFESETAEFGKKVVEKSLAEGIFEKSDGAIVFKAEKYDSKLHTRVFINSQGLPTYEAKELGLAKLKKEAFDYTLSIVLTGNEVNDYFRVLLKAMELVFPDLAKETIHKSHGMLRLPSGKMSSRTGEVITAESLIFEVEKMVAEKIKDRGYDKKLQKEIIEAVSIGAIKYSILKQAIGGDIIFDFEKSISFEGDSGPYLQYAYARAKSVLEKAKSEKVKASVKKTPNNITLVERMLGRFPEVVERAGKENMPHYIATYLIELAGAFNSFYASEKIVDKADEFSSYKIALTESFATVMRNGLWLLGIKVPSKM